MKIVVSFATDRFYASQDKLELEAYKHGADKVIKYRPCDIDKEFVKQNYKILHLPRGAGYWLWKPYFILKTLRESEPNDKILYCDSGSYPIADLSIVYDLIEQNEILLFRLLDKVNRHWTKGDCFSLMGCDKEKYYNIDQTLATFQGYKNVPTAEHFLEQYLGFCCNYNIITDAPNIHSENFSDFIEHRHDQSVLTNLSIKWQIERFRDPSQFGNEQTLENSKYPQIFKHHRGKI